jgi:hypothetical protein
MAVCSFREYKKEILCPSDLKHFARIIERSMQGDALGEEEQNSTELLTVLEAWVAVDTDNFTYNYRPINGVNATDRSTHRISFRFSDLNNLQIDVTKHIIEIDSVRYRINELVNVGMDNEILDCFCILRGSDGYISQC